MLMCPSIPTQERNTQCEVGEAGDVQTVCTLQGSERRTCCGWYFCSITFSRYILTASHELTMTLRSHQLSIETCMRFMHQHGPGPPGSSIQEFFQVHFKREVCLSSHPPSFPIITHSPGFVILKISTKFPSLSWPDSHKSLGNCPNSLALPFTISALSEPPWGSQHHLAQVLTVSTSVAFSSWNSAQSESADQENLKLQMSLVPVQTRGSPSSFLIFHSYHAL